MSFTPIYLDNAATTPFRKEVKERMMELIEEGPFGNPSSTHQYGRKARVIVEDTRRYIAQSLRCHTGEIVFTSGGTEADNAALILPVRDLGIKRIITSPLEHHAVLHTSEYIQRNYQVELQLLKVNSKGEVDINHLEDLLKDEKPTLVSLMHGNNEIGNLLDIVQTGALCRQYGALFHSDTVQTVGHFDLNLEDLPVDFITASSHKFYGPKGVGFLFINKDVKVASFITGGAQERNMRGGTENILGLAGLKTALEQCLIKLEEEKAHILSLKRHLIEKIKSDIPTAIFNGMSADLDKSLYTVLSIGFPELKNDNMLLFNLDLKGIAVSGGSACASGSLQGSHVISAVTPAAEYPVVRISMGKDNTEQEIDVMVEALKELNQPLP